MDRINKLSNIDETTEEGRLLMAAIGKLRTFYPDRTHLEILNQLKTISNKIFTDDNDRRNIKETRASIEPKATLRGTDVTRETGNEDLEH